MLPGVSWQADDWLSSRLNRPAYRGQFEPNAAQNLPEGAFAYLKLRADQTPELRSLLAAGAYLADTLLQFAKPLNQGLTSILDSHVRWTMPEDRPAVRAIARQSFRYSRFHQDALFSRDQADELKAAWVENFYQGERGDRLAVLEHAGETAGFVQLFCRPEAWTIDLIALRPDLQGQGLGRALLHFTETEAEKSGARQLRVGTQLLNAPSIRLYEAWGFRFEAAQHVLHFVQESRV